ncbi:acyl-coenzyme A thioesterase 9, mitochondrial-like isoform X2 [Pollicipes pollicipes]|uniref:acyl-coenzyme A thioesterase 9, mitochondrial-like isoform X2 n=1 Tax=Pollicipes pollicipes TaxID=41117 RepID=UPI00188584BF|nr:acyl-coenzyme A thioesterase 9, mitochondrial-like isoform X2 [Pollicipes pollicipes]
MLENIYGVPMCILAFSILSRYSGCIRMLSSCLTRGLTLAKSVAAIRHISIFHGRLGRQTVQDVIARLESLTGAQTSFAPQQSSDRAALERILPRSQDELPARRMSDSYDEAFIPLGSDLKLRDKYINYMGGVRSGRLMEDIDVFAVWLCYRYVLNPKQLPNMPSPFCIVTALVDRIDFSAHNLKPDADIRLSGKVTYVGTSSMETTVVLEQLSAGQWQQVTKAEMVMVARDPLNKGSAVVNPLLAETPEEVEMVKQGNVNKLRRKQMSEQSLFKLPPTPSEVALIHQVFIDTVDHGTFRQRRPDDALFMSEAKLKNLIICHPEHRNRFGRIFGGFLMRQAIELAWANAMVTSGSRPRLTHVDDILFRKPVDVGSLLYLLSRVVYTEHNNLQLCVSAEVVHPRLGTRDLTNVFYFTFSAKEPVKVILPQTYHEMMMFLDGRRHYQALIGEKKFYGQADTVEDAHSGM